jgi:very-short-patch-repair endonuclease
MNRMGTKPANAAADPLIARIAARQHGVISVAQLLAAGLSHRAIQVRIQAGRLHRIHRGVYAVGHRNLTPQGWWMAAVLACGEGAVLSHRSAAMHWGMLKPVSSPVDVTVSGTAGRDRRKGIRVHRSTSLMPNAVTIRKGIPTTTPARTIRDLRRVVDRPTLEAAVAQAEINHLPIGDLPGLLHEPTRSELERRFLRLCRRHGLPKPEVNVRVGPYEVDFLWRDRKVIVETDGYATYGGRSAFNGDKTRDARLRTVGYSVQRFAYRHVTHEAAFVAETVRALLGAGRGSS